MTHEIDTTAPRYREPSALECPNCGGLFEGRGLVTNEDFQAKGGAAPEYCSVRCVENAIEAAGMAAAKAALR